MTGAWLSSVFLLLSAGGPRDPPPAYYFTGNYPPAAMVEACVSGLESPADEAGWESVTPRLKLKGDDRIYVPVDRTAPVTHLRLNIYPDSSVARLISRAGR